MNISVFSNTCSRKKFSGAGFTLINAEHWYTIPCIDRHTLNSSVNLLPLNIIPAFPCMWMTRAALSVVSMPSILLNHNLKVLMETRYTHMPGQGQRCNIILSKFMEKMEALHCFSATRMLLFSKQVMMKTQEKSSPYVKGINNDWLLKHVLRLLLVNSLENSSKTIYYFFIDIHFILSY